MKTGIALGVALIVLAFSSIAHGATYAVTTTPNSHDFGSADVGGTSAPSTFTLRVHCDVDPANENNCLNAHPFTPNVTVTGDFAIQGNGCTSLMPGSDAFGTTCTFNVVFAPTAAGARSGIVDVGEPGGFAKASVTGTGVTPPLGPITTVPPPAATAVAPKKKCRKKHRSATAAKKKCRKRR